MSSVTLIRRIAARPEIVFDAIATSDGISHWWGPDAGPVVVAETDVRVGGRFRVRFRMLGGSEHETTGEFLEIKRPTRLVMSWRWLTGESEGESRIELELRAIESGTELTFTHALLPDERTRKDHEEGWNGALDKLQRYLGHDRR
jgi:uncharacterized protein YndB with AHSA1/START domain